MGGGHHHGPGVPAAETATKLRAALLSVGASVMLTCAKALAALLSGSLALLSEALHGLIDIMATVVTYFAVKAADQPADEEHHYGHGKVEALAALGEVALLFALAGGVIWEAYGRLAGGGHGHAIEVTPLVTGMMVFAILVDVTRWRALTKVARETRSEALAADALHFSADAVSSTTALAGLGAVWLGYPNGDAIAAFGVALFIGIAGFRLARRTVDTLLDAAPTGSAERLRALAEGTPAIVGVERVRVRPSGGQILGEIAVQISRTLPLDQVAEIKRLLQTRIHAEMPGADVTVTTAPVALSDETALERVMFAASRLRIPVHHVTIHHVGEQLSVSLDVEVDATLTMEAAHEVASRLEAAIRTEFGAGTEVETHIEPLELSAHSGHSATWETVEEIGHFLTKEAAAGGIVSEIHNVRVRQTERGLVVNYHARVPADLGVSEAHQAVDRIERALRGARGDVCRVVTHAEPLRGPKD